MHWQDDPRLSEMVSTVAEGVQLPRMAVIERRRTSTAGMADVQGNAHREMRALLAGADGRGAPIAVGVGSRGIRHLAVMVKAVIGELVDAGYSPFIVPAMGSHGGATAEGQVEVLEGQGISEATMGVPVRATMDTVVVGDVDGRPVFLDRNVVDCGLGFLVNRIKPHTDFHADIESGPAKMAAIGLGKQAGAQQIHGLGLHGLRDVMPQVGRFVASRWLLGALAVVENEREETALIRGLRPSEIGTRVESELLNQARCFLPELPLRDVDVLVVDRMGKDISGTGMDPNVIGRWLVPGMVEPVDTTVRTIVVLDLTERSHGNAIGLGLADFIPGSLAHKVDLSATYINTLTSGWAGLRRGRLPIVLPTARTTLLAAIAAAGAIGRPVRMLWIHDTLSLSRFAASESLWPELTEDPATTVGSPFELAFGDDGALLPAPE